jgi:hypothetical protein
MDKLKIEEDFIKEALFNALEKSLNPEFEGINRCGYRLKGCHKNRPLVYNILIRSGEI